MTESLGFLGIGIAVFFGFLRMVKLPDPLAWAGVALGIAILIGSIMPPHLAPSGAQMALYGIGVALIVGAFTWQLSARPPQAPTLPDTAKAPANIAISQGGAGGAATAGPGGIAIGGPGGHSGGSPGRGGDGGGSGSTGDLVVGGGGGSVDGPDIWYPPAPSGYEVLMRAQGQKPDPEMKRFGRGGMSPGYATRFEIVEGLRRQFFEDGKKPYRSVNEDIEAMPLAALNAALQDAGHPWRARIVEGYYEFFIPKSG